MEAPHHSLYVRARTHTRYKKKKKWNDMHITIELNYIQKTSFETPKEMIISYMLSDS